MRKTVMALAAVAVLTAGSTMAALAHGGGGHGGGGGGGHGGGFGGGHMGGGFGGSHMGGGFGRAAFAHGGGFAGPHAFHFHRGHDFGHHRFFRRAFFFDAGYPYYAYDDSCRVWTRWGWRWICY